MRGKKEKEREKERGRTENEIGNIVNSQRRGDVDAVKLESFAQRKRATPRLASVNKIAERTTLTSTRCGEKRERKRERERETTIPYGPRLHATPSCYRRDIFAGK